MKTIFLVAVEERVSGSALSAKERGEVTRQARDRKCRVERTKFRTLVFMRIAIEFDGGGDEGRETDVRNIVIPRRVSVNHPVVKCGQSVLDRVGLGCTVGKNKLAKIEQCEGTVHVLDVDNASKEMGAGWGQTPNRGAERGEC